MSSVGIDESKDSHLEFDPSIGEDERKFYMKAYPTIDCVKDRKTHCTVCKMHIGTAPSNESIIKMHPILRVTHCTKCHDFYNSGEFSKGEDGSELYCRWCGQGGEVYCCSNCPFVFCKSCIIKNLSRGVVADIEQNENWSCFNCAPKILWPLRAQHWALINYIEKQKKIILASNLSEREMKIQMSKDRSSCCRLKPKSDNDDSSESSEVKCFSGEKRFRKIITKSPDAESPTPKKSRLNDEVVCTPDLLSMLIPDCELTVASKNNKSATVPVATSPKIMSIQQPTSGYNSINSNQQQQSTISGGEAAKAVSPPPLVMRNSNVTIRPTVPSPVVRRTIVGPRTPTPTTGTTPVYHTINGFRIDLNSAAQQETFRLPNGKLIQVKRQGSGGIQPNAVQTQQMPQQQQSQSPIASPSVNPWSRNGSPMQGRGIQISHGPSSAPSIPQYPPPQQQHQLSHQLHVPTIGSTTVRYINQSQIAQNIHNGSIQLQMNGVTNGSNAMPTSNIPTVVQGSTTTIRPVMIRHIFPDSPIGNARTQLQNQIFNAMEICQHLVGKLQTLTNSNAYKLARNQIDIKELYIHLSYLLTYANGRFKGLQDKCLDDMRQLGFIHDADSLENGQLAAGADYVRFGQVEDVDLFNVGTNSFHNQILDYRRSINMNDDYDENDCSSPPTTNRTPSTEQVQIKIENDPDALDIEENPIPPIDEEEPSSYSTFVKEEPKSDTEMDQYSYPSFNNYVTPDFTGFSSSQQYSDERFDEEAADEDNDVDDDGNETGDGDESNGDDSNSEHSERNDDDNSNYEIGFNRRNKKIRDPPAQVKNDRKLIKLIEQCPAIWNTCDPDYGNYSCTKKMWRDISRQFPRNMNLKLRWKNLRRRFVRLEANIRKGKRIYSFHDKSINFLLNRNTPKIKWVSVDKGDNEEHYDYDDTNASQERVTKLIKDPKVNPKETTKDKDVKKFNSSTTSKELIREINETDRKIIKFVEANKILWLKDDADGYAEEVEEECNHLWMKLQKMFSDKINVQSRWSDMYEMYKAFRLTKARDGSLLERLRLKQSKYLQKLSFLREIDDDRIIREYQIDPPFDVQIRNHHNYAQKTENKSEKETAESIKAQKDYEESQDLDQTGEEKEKLDENEKDESLLKSHDIEEEELKSHEKIDRQFVIELVRAVREYPIIWNSKYPHYDGSSENNDLWHEIANNLKKFEQKQASDDEDNEIEIVEPKTDTITLDSDNEEDEIPRERTENTDPPPLTSLVSVVSTMPQVVNTPPPAIATTTVVDQFSVSSSTTSASSQVSNPSIVISSAVSSAAPISSTSLSSAVENVSEPAEFFAVTNILADMLETELTESNSTAATQSAANNVQNAAVAGDSKIKKQPRKKTTNKPNPTLIKQKEILERERLEEMKRNDAKLKRKCVISLSKAEDVFPYAKLLVEQVKKFNADASNSDKSEAVEVILVVDEQDNNIEDGGDKLHASSEQERKNPKTLNYPPLEKSNLGENSTSNQKRNPDSDAVEVFIADSLDNSIEECGSRASTDDTAPKHEAKKPATEVGGAPVENKIPISSQNEVVEVILDDELDTCVKGCRDQVSSDDTKQKRKNIEKENGGCALENNNFCGNPQTLMNDDNGTNAEMLLQRPASTRELKAIVSQQKKEVSCPNPTFSPLVNGETEVDVDHEIDKLLRLRDNDCTDALPDDLNLCIDNSNDITTDQGASVTSTPELSDDITELVLGESDVLF